MSGGYYNLWPTTLPVLAMEVPIMLSFMLSVTECLEQKSTLSSFSLAQVMPRKLFPPNTGMSQIPTHNLEVSSTAL